MNEIKVCSLCEVSCTDEHKYEYGYGKFYHLCERCWVLIRAVIKEYNNEGVSMPLSKSAIAKPEQPAIPKSIPKKKK